MLEELRALIPGGEVLFGFLLAIRFTGQFTDLNTVQRYVYYATLVSTAVALVFLLAPSAYHRLRFREGDKDAMVRKGNREAIAGTGAIALILDRLQRGGGVARERDPATAAPSSSAHCATGTPSCSGSTGG